MKKSLFLILVILTATASYACSTCGCASYSAFMGISNYRFTNYIGLNWAHYAFREDAEDNIQNLNDYNRFELKGALAIGKKWQALITLPYIMNGYSISDAETISPQTFHFTGQGDMNISGQYLLYSNADSVMRNTKHFLTASAGVELPTGKFNTNFRTDKLPAALATGSGSVDMLAGLQYTMATMKWNLRAACQFKLNTQNRTGYNFGEQYSADVYVARKIDLQQSILAPYAGLSMECITPDKYYSTQMEGTGSSIYAVNTGIELSLKKLNIGGYVAVPLKNTAGNSELQNSLKLQAYASFTL